MTLVAALFAVKKFCPYCCNPEEYAA